MCALHTIYCGSGGITISGTISGTNISNIEFFCNKYLPLTNVITYNLPRENEYSRTKNIVQFNAATYPFIIQDRRRQIQNGSTFCDHNVNTCNLHIANINEFLTDEYKKSTYLTTFLLLKDYDMAKGTYNKFDEFLTIHPDFLNKKSLFVSFDLCDAKGCHIKNKCAIVLHVDHNESYVPIPNNLDQTIKNMENANLQQQTTIAKLMSKIDLYENKDNQNHARINELEVNNIYLCQMLNKLEHDLSRITKIYENLQPLLADLSMPVG